MKFRNVQRRVGGPEDLHNTIVAEVDGMEMHIPEYPGNRHYEEIKAQGIDVALSKVPPGVVLPDPGRPDDTPGNRP